MASKYAADPSQPEPTNSNIIINSLKEFLIPMDTKMIFIYDEMRLLKSKTEEATEMAAQALNSATSAQNNANEAIKLSTDANLKLTNIKKRLKVLEETTDVLSSQTDETTYPATIVVKWNLKGLSSDN